MSHMSACWSVFSLCDSRVGSVEIAFGLSNAVHNCIDYDGNQQKSAFSALVAAAFANLVMLYLPKLSWSGNVSRGATRGNQGQKGVLGPPDFEGRCVLQLRVQPGVLAVRLNRQASEWYRMLDDEVNRALKLTKTYWRKARRRQDYDARADQDHMELHEWLQQLKDKVMSHLELLMQKGEIQGPPYVMPDQVELAFLRKFVERQRAGIPHNPRLRRAYLHTSAGGAEQQHIQAQASVGTSTPLSTNAWDGAEDAADEHDHPNGAAAGVMEIDDVHALMRDIESSRTPSLLSTEISINEQAKRSSTKAFVASRMMQIYRNEYGEGSVHLVVIGRRAESPGQTNHDISQRRPQSRTSSNDSQDDVMSPIGWRDMHWPQVNTMGEAAGQNTELTMLERVGLFTLLVTTENITALRQTMGVPSREHEMQLNHLSAERKHARGWDHLPQTQGREGFEVGRTVYTLQPSSSYHPQDVSLLPPPKRHQVSPAMLGSTSTSLPPSLRQSALPSMTAADQQRMDQNVAILLNAQSGSHLGNVPL
ncbi:predicted protein [Postia placenta Mad-698-R]|uniref:Uncharacterized protein n=1 Tax=Postia placenta MAD-698-R-SB12 TaxID=670580 RepID=A0A1X6MS70_9APHY|nr:hypothetical protein POSPLADRAFT_1152191 [Postia placenta MAD-698-R-SB12]EED79107.1 predicted protein [Postia placenta Mad-698-R]OSX59110.1 hypothetical protein POSPLADRAFT_1152191 [Postia placenta MAD-698-R-SB12]